ncbi:TPA: SDR family NAD(P)-dependent oxidoreductase [Legionella pneumophila]|nr:SDR family NAD(P)-dependent oxidoreductase [Legionella pneumophila]HCJ1112945.1 SDR family NAD(P)-dependent oxidoreductase [Legionella pneumophila]
MNEFRVKLTSDNYLVDDHRIDGVRVLPGIAYLDIVARCLTCECFELTQVNYPHAAKVHEGETLILSVVHDPQSRELVIYHQMDDKKIIHFKALIELTIKPYFPVAIPIQKEGIQSHSMETIYSLARDAFIEHGEFMRVAGTTQINAPQIQMELSLSAKAQPFLSRFYLHPALLDGATFAIAALHFDEVLNAGTDISYLPLGIDKVTVYGRVTASTLLIKAETIPTNNDSLIKCRIHLFNSDGQLLVVLEGLTNKRFERSQFAKQSHEQASVAFKSVSGSTQDKIIALIKNNLTAVPALLEPKVSFFDLGFDSSDLIALVIVLEQQFNLELYPTLLFEQNNLQKLTDYIDSCSSSSLSVNEPLTKQENDDYAVYIPTKSRLKCAPNNNQVLLIDNYSSAPSSLNYDQALAILEAQPELNWVFYDVSYYQTSSNLQIVLHHLVNIFSKLVRWKQADLPLLVIALSPKQLTSIQSVTAFISCLRKEYPHLKCSVLVSEDCNKIDVSSLTGIEGCVYEFDKQLYTQSYMLQGQGRQESNSVIKHQGRYLIVGGNGGLGRLLITYLKTQYQAQIHVIGRKEPNAAAFKEQIIYHQLDVSDSAAVSNFFKANDFPIDGLFYLAGEKHDGLMINTKPENIDATVRSKLSGLSHMHQALQHQAIDFYCAYSSISADIGNLGQCIYAAANAALNAYAIEQEQLRIAGKHTSRFISISWPYWLEGGMGIDAHHLKQLRTEFRTLPLGTTQAFALLEQALAANVPHIVIANKFLLADRVIKSQAGTPVKLNKSDKLPEINNPEISNKDIAIIGISFELPDASNLEELWNNLSTAKNSIKTVNRNWHYVPYSWGGYLDNIAAFDPLFFNISPREAALIDPQERLFLANAWHCLEDAGYAKGKDKNIGVIAASMFHLYQHYGVEQCIQEIDAKLPQSSSASIANRVSYALDLTGPSFSLDSMCSSSLSAIDLACRYLVSNEVDAMLVGGVNLCSHPFKLATLVQNKFLSSSGTSAPFHEKADGYVPGEGVVVLLLKNAQKALADGDSIYALIKGLAVNHGGMGSGFTVPNASSQARVINRALTNAGINPEQIDYVEAHGTGTSLGDPIELDALKRVFANRSSNKPLYVGSIKSNLGHLESAAGMAGIAKVIAQFQAQAIAPSINALPLNPNLNINDVPIKIITNHLNHQSLQFAGISSFGAGGSNAHLILQNFSFNRRHRPKTQYNKQDFWLHTSSPTKFHCYHVDTLACPQDIDSVVEEIYQLDTGIEEHYFGLATPKTRLNKAVIFLIEARLNPEQLITLLTQCIAVNPEVQLIFVHQSQTSWHELHALMMSMPSMTKHYQKNILIPYLSNLVATQVATIVNQESQQLDYRMMTYHEGRHTLALNLIKPNSALPKRLLNARIVVLGGLGTIGYQFCHTLIAAGVTQFDVIGRSTLNTKRQQLLQALGHEVHYIQHDFTEPYSAPYYDLIINSLGVMPGNGINEVEQRKQLRQNLAAFIQQNNPRTLISISSLSAWAGFSNNADYAVYNASLIELNDYCQEHVLAYLPFVMSKTSESPDDLNWLTWSKHNQGLEPIRTDDLPAICSQLLNLPAGEYIPFQGYVKQFHTYISNECLSVPVKQLNQHKPFVFNTDSSLYQLIEAILGVSADQIKPTKTFYQLGFNSLTLTELAEVISKNYGVQINPSQFFELHTLGKLEDYLVPHKKELLQQVSLKQVPSETNRVVICGYHCSFAQCLTPEHFWNALLAGQDCTQMPIGKRFIDKENESMMMGFIENHAHFDFDFFELGYEQAKYMDPQHRKLLELSWHVFEQSGISPSSLKGSNTGVFVAIQFDDYARLLDRSQLTSLYQITGCAKTFAANRISHFFDFHGPSETIDTACSSSFSALNRAVHAINNGECESALVLGVSLICDAKTLELTAQLNVLSASNRCRPFDIQADGYVKGEGLAGLWLVSETKAIEQKLRIDANIEAIQVNHGGNSQSLTAPNPAAQKQLLAEVYKTGTLAPDQIDYFEAHATATRLGDPIEFSALKEVFGSRKKPLYLGSVKSNIGHTEPVAGLAGIIKGLLMLKHQIIPPQVNFNQINPYIKLEESPFKISQQATPTTLSMIAINSFGFGGSNGHCVLSQNQLLPRESVNFPFLPIKLSAKTDTALATVQQQLVDYLNSSNQDLCLTQLSFTLNMGRTDFVCRKMLIVESIEDLKQQLQQTNNAHYDPIKSIVSEQTLLDFYQSPNQLKDYLNSLANKYEQGEIIDWKGMYCGLNIVPLILPVYPFALTYCWFEQAQPDTLIGQSEKKHINCYEQVWRKKKISAIDLNCYQVITVFMTRSQQPFINKALQQLGFNGVIHYVLVDDHYSLEQGMHLLEEQPCDLIYYFAGMSHEQLSTAFLQDSQQLGMASFLNVIKKLEQLAYADKPLTLYVYSNNAYGLNTKTIHPFAASLHGLAQSLKKEYPSWFIECIDIDDINIVSQALTVSSEGQAYPLIFANHNVWHRQLQVVEMTLNKAPNQNKVLVLIGGDGQVGKYLVSEFIKNNPRAIIIACRKAVSRTEGVLHWKPLDCTIAADVGRFIEEIIQQYGKIDCLYHLGAHYAESSIASLGYDDYLAQMRVKVLGTYHLINACNNKAVDQVFITSSVQVYTQNKNRGAYSATCFYADALVEAMRSEKTKLVHWGFWQQENEDANKLMRSAGVSPITAEQGYHALQLATGSVQSNLSFFNVTESVKALMPICSNLIDQEKEDLGYFNEGLHALEHFCFDLVKNHLVTNGVVWSQCELSQNNRLHSDYANYYRSLIKMLKDFEQKQGITTNQYQIKSLEHLLQQQFELIRKYPQIKPFVNLLMVCAKNLTAVVTGEKSIQQIMFPYGRDDLVRAIYQKNLLAKYYNQAIASVIKGHVAITNKPLDVLELGGGTGATTEAVLTQCLHNIRYTFSDVNPQFVTQAKKQFAHYEHIETCILDINEPLINKQFDLIIASNVLHTTNDIRQCLINIIPLLRDEGVLIINEATANSLFLAFTFGLFKQWHANKDEYRINASALLESPTWQRLLQEMGFDVHIHAMPLEIDQSIFVAKLKTGIIQTQKAPVPIIMENKSIVSGPEFSRGDQQLLSLLARHLNCPVVSLNLNKSLAHYGFDSLAAIHLAEQIKCELGITITPTVLLDNIPLTKIISFIENKKEESLC